MGNVWNGGYEVWSGGSNFWPFGEVVPLTDLSIPSIPSTLSTIKQINIPFFPKRKKEIGR
jgi:hypothetical protein